MQVTLFTRTQLTLTCQSAVVVDSSTLRCTLPELDSGSPWYQTSVSVQARFLTAGQTSNFLSLGSLFLAPLFPIITSVFSSGCVSLSPLQLSACQPGSVISITGSNLNASSPALFAAPDWASIYTTDALRLPYRGWLTMNNDSLTYEMPAVEFDTQAVQLDVVYEFVLYQWPATGATVSNSFTVTFTSPSSPAASTGPSTEPSSSSGLSGGAIAGVVIGVLVALVLLIGATVFLLRLRSSSVNTPSSYNRQDDDRMQSSMY